MLKYRLIKQKKRIWIFHAKFECKILTSGKEGIYPSIFQIVS